MTLTYRKCLFFLFVCFFSFGKTLFTETREALSAMQGRLLRVLGDGPPVVTDCS